MPLRQSSLAHFVLHCAAMFACILALKGQTPVVHDMPNLGLPVGEPTDLRYGPSGGTFAVSGRGAAAKLFVYDGTGWDLCRELGARNIVLPTVNGELILFDGSELYTYQWRFRAPPVRHRIGVLPKGEFVALAQRVLDATTSSKDISGFTGNIALETGSGIFTCIAGTCIRRTDRTVQLLGVAHGEIFVIDADGKVERLDRPGKSNIQLPPACRNPTPVGFHATAGMIFRQDSLLWSLDVHARPEKALQRIGSCQNDETIAIVGKWALRFKGGDAIEAAPLQVPLVWRNAHRTALHRDKPARLPRGPILFYRTADRLVVRTEAGLASIEPKPTSAIDVGIESSLAATLGTHAGGLLIGQAAAVSHLTYDAQNGSELISRFATFDNMMRNSIPTVVGSWNHRIVVGTSDARVLVLNKGRKPDELINVRELGTAVTDLRVAGGRLWGIFEATSPAFAGLFVLDQGGNMTLYGDTTGLHQPVSCVREAPSGTVFVSSRSGDKPLHCYFEEQNLWMPLAGSIPKEPYESTMAIHEIAPVTDSLIYLATSRGLFVWQAKRGYEMVPLPQELYRADIRSVIAQREGIWFAVEGRGTYFFGQSGLRAIEGSGHWKQANFRARGLVPMPDGGVCVLDGSQLVRLDRPNLNSALAYPGIAFANRPGHAYASFAQEHRSLTHQEGDSLYVSYALPGDATPDLVASFALNGQALLPIRTEAGLAVFAPMSPGDYAMSVRVMAPHRGHSAAELTQRIRVLRHWWTTPFGYFLVVFMVCVLVAAVAYANAMRQQHLARALEALIAERTADLALAQRRVERASAAKSMFLANMSHEIRTPLNAVLGMSDLLLSGDLRDDQQEYVHAIKRGGSVLHGIVGDILDFAEIDNGSVHRRDEIFELPLLLNEIAQRYAERASECGLDFGYRFAVPDVVKADGHKFKSIISHLLANAVKFTEKGFLRLDVEFVATQGAEQGDVVIRVTDTGIGIALVDQERIYSVFEQVDNSNTRRYGGTGLGLAIVKLYVECLGGAMSIKSALGQGSCFEVRLPVSSAPSVLPAAVGLSRPEKPLNALLCNQQEFYAAQLSSLFQGSLDIDTAITPKGRPDVYLPPAESRDVLIYVYRRAEGLVAFRQNPYTQSHRRAGLPVVIIGLRRDLLNLALEQGEEKLAYPLDLGEEVRLPMAWRAMLRQAVPRELFGEASKHSESTAHANVPNTGRSATATDINVHVGISTTSLLAKRTRTKRATLSSAPSADVAKATSLLQAQSVNLTSEAATQELAQSPIQAITSSATPSASPSATPSASPSAAPSATPSASPSVAPNTIPSSPPTAKPIFFDLAAEAPLSILVAEDNAMNKTLILTVLTKLGYQADWAENGAVAVERFAARPYDLILMDVHMPEVDGLEATRRIRSHYADRPVTICALTANASEDGRRECIESGMDDFMSKPLQLPKLIETLRGVVPMAERMQATSASIQAKRTLKLSALSD